MATLIKRSKITNPKPQVGNQITFPVWVPLQSVGEVKEERSGKVTKVNRVTVDAVDEYGNTWKVRMDEII